MEKHDIIKEMLEGMDMGSPKLGQDIQMIKITSNYSIYRQLRL